MPDIRLQFCPSGMPPGLPGGPMGSCLGLVTMTFVVAVVVDNRTHNGFDHLTACHRYDEED